MPSPSPPRPASSEAKESNLKQRLLERKERRGGAERNMADSVVTPPISDRPDPPFQHSIQQGDADRNTSVASGADARVTRPLSARLHPSLPLKPVAAMAAAATHETFGDDKFSSTSTWRGRELLGSDARDGPRSGRRVDGDDDRPHRRYDHDANPARDTRVVEQPRRGGGVGRSDGRSDWREPPPHAMHTAHSRHDTSASSMGPGRRTSPSLRDSYRPTYSTNSPPRDRNRESSPHDNRHYNSRGPRDRRDHKDTISETGTGLSRHADRDPRTMHGDLSLPPRPPVMPPFGPTMNVPREHPNKGGGGNANLTPTAPMNFEQRRQLRESTQVNIWPESPKRPYVEDVKNLESKSRRGKSSKSSSRRKRRYASDSESDSEEEYERERRRRKRRERERERERDRESRGTSRDTDIDQRRRVDSDDQRERERKRDRGRRSRRHSSEAGSDRPTSSTKAVEAADDGPEVGPQLPAEHGTTDRYDREAFRDLLPGEGRAMQAFVEKGERIPRRGEIGMDMKKIQEFENSGYVMSGSRHQRMNAVRLRKEGQVINAEEKRAMLMQSREEWIEKEGAIISQFKEMMDERLKMEEKRERERDKKDRR